MAFGLNVARLVCLSLFIVKLLESVWPASFLFFCFHESLKNEKLQAESLGNIPTWTHLKVHPVFFFLSKKSLPNQVLEHNRRLFYIRASTAGAASESRCNGLLEIMSSYGILIVSPDLCRESAAGPECCLLLMIRTTVLRRRMCSPSSVRRVYLSGLILICTQIQHTLMCSPSVSSIMASHALY